MTTKKVFFGLSGMLAALIIAIGAGVYFGVRMLNQKSDELVTAKLDTYLAEETEISYKKAQNELKVYQSLGETLNKILPKDKDQARAIAELYKIGSETGVSIDSVRFPTSTLGQKAAPTTTSGSSGSSTSTSAPAAPAITQAKPVAGIQGVLGIDVDISATGPGTSTISYDDMIRFLQKIEQNRRSMQIKSITVTPNQGGGVSFGLTLTIFVKP